MLPQPARPNCLKCLHFKISWDPMLPYSCDIFSIKSRFLPSLEVFRSAGGNCPSFRPKN
ncbi:MAG: hypothetical protein FWG46_07960 [Treponema sp.]|nr:hypothetical protein [Treponema sp.]